MRGLTMKSSKQLVGQLQAKQGMPQEQTSTDNTWTTDAPTGEIPKDVWVKGWASLELSRLVHDGPSSQTSEFWRHSCKSLSNQALIEGSQRATEFVGKLTLGKFKEMCFENRPRHLQLKDKTDDKRIMPKEKLKGLLANLREELSL